MWCCSLETIRGREWVCWPKSSALTVLPLPSYAVSMSKRITVVLDDAVAEGIALLDGRSASARVNEALRKAIDREQRRVAGLEWIRAMNAELGNPSAQDYEDADRLLDELGVPRTETKEVAA
jgi:Arc/MetJ-type ribon-helix-helix transcriptional regulator